MCCLDDGWPTAYPRVSPEDSCDKICCLIPESLQSPDCIGELERQYLLSMRLTESLVLLSILRQASNAVTHSWISVPGPMPILGSTSWGKCPFLDCCHVLCRTSMIISTQLSSACCCDGMSPFRDLPWDILCRTSSHT